jgi:DNA polymerase iota
VIAMIDMDCFYAQVEEVNNPALRGHPMAVTQKFIVVTCNYAARAFGVGKLMSIVDAQRCCPALRLVNGEDLTAYRRASDQVRRVLTAEVGECEHACMDEFFIDLSGIVARAQHQQRLVWYARVRVYVCHSCQ